MSTPQRKDAGVRIEPVDRPEDIEQAFHCLGEAFGRQAQDGVWTAMNPGWDTPTGKASGAARMVARWRGITTDKNGNPNTVFLKATVPSAQADGERTVAGLAIWAQASCVEGYGDPPSEDMVKAMNLEELYPGNETEQRYLAQVMTSFLRKRNEVIKEKASSTQPAVLVLDICAVDPAHQRKGIAKGLVQWGLDEAKRRVWGDSYMRKWDLRHKGQMLIILLMRSLLVEADQPTSSCAGEMGILRMFD
ncbi:unnamed protein product [Penicillium manginii]